MKTNQANNIFANCEVVKRKELSKSYGELETIKVPFILEFDKCIYLLNECGEFVREMRLGTKLLYGYTGTPISERALKIRENKNLKIREANRLIRQENERIANESSAKKLSEQEAILKSTFEADKEFLAKIQDRINNHSGKDWRGWIKMKVCAKVFGGKFENMKLPSTSIRDIALSIN